MISDRSAPEQEALSQRRILIVEDEESLAIPLTDRLVSEGYQVETASDGKEGLRKALSGDFDLLLLDVMLPGMSGFDICREVRQKNIQAPILMLTARGELVDKVLGLKLGADDYLTKPFEMMELVARIDALLRRAQTPITSSMRHYAFGGVDVDFQAAEVHRNGRKVALSALEFRLLRYFIENRGKLLSRNQLLDEVWGYDTMLYTRTVDAHVAALRRKLESNPSKPRFIVTVRGMGYRFTG